MRRLAVLSMHTSPLAQPGTGDGGGMNVYVRELTTALARAGVECDVYTRAWSPSLPATVTVEPGFRVHHVPAGPLGAMAKEQLPAVVDEFTDNVRSLMVSGAGVDPGFHEETGYDALHANYWLSGLAGHRLKHELDLPLVSTFHTLARVKAEASPEEVRATSPTGGPRPRRRSCGARRWSWPPARWRPTQLAGLYDADPDRIQVVAPGVDHAFFGPGAPAPGPAGRWACRPTCPSCCSWVGSSRSRGPTSPSGRWPSSGTSPTPTSWWWAGPSGPRGEEHLAPGAARSCAGRGWADGCTWSAPQPHELLSTYYRAADVCVVPSRSESFGLVALEAAACGTPVVAAAVGGLTTLVDHGTTGYLVENSTAAAFAGAVGRVLADPLQGERLATAAVVRARRYTWAEAATLLRATYEELTAERLMACR